jgi:hypothetical protein
LSVEPTEFFSIPVVDSIGNKEGSNCISLPS